jgi:CheY-like chemotaxis protein
MPIGGRITITASSGDLAESAETRVGAAHQPSGVVISVSDNGTGMSQNVLDRAFEPFFTTKGIGEGSGLGLSMVFGFAQQSGGNVKIRSTPQGGTTVTLRLPIYEGEFHEDASTEVKLALPAPRFSGTVLLVEDDSAVRNVLVEVLRQSSATVLMAGNGEEGLKVLAEDPHIDVVVTDIGLPGDLSGYEFADAARRMRPGMPFLFISGYSSGQAGAETAILPHDRLLHKPFKTGIFLETLAGMRWNAKRREG